MLHIAVFENIMQQLIAIINLNGWFTHINIKNQDIKKLTELLSSEREDLQQISYINTTWESMGTTQYLVCCRRVLLKKKQF